MKNYINKISKVKFVMINGQKYVKDQGFLTLAGPIKNTIDSFHNYKQKQLA